MPVRHIGMPVRNQTLDHGNHSGDMGGGTRGIRRSQRAQCLHICVIPANGFIRAGADDLFERPRRAPLPTAQGRRVDLVIHIGEIAHISYLVRPIDLAQQAVEHIKHHHRPRVAQMGALIDRGPAHIHAHVRRVEGGKILFAAGAGVVKSHGGMGHLYAGNSWPERRRLCPFVMFKRTKTNRPVDISGSNAAENGADTGDESAFWGSVFRSHPRGHLHDHLCGHYGAIMEPPWAGAYGLARGLSRFCAGRGWLRP